MDESWGLNNADLMQQIGTLMWAVNDDKAPKMVENMAAMRVGYEVYQRLSGQRDVDALRNQTIMAIAKYVKDHPKASKEELLKEISKQIALFVKKLAQTILPRLEFTQTQLCLQLIEDIGIRPVLNSTVNNEDERGENKSGANISLYTVIH